MSNDFYCKDCNGLMQYIENCAKNSWYTIKFDTWSCMRCGRIVEEARKIEGVVYK